MGLQLDGALVREYNEVVASMLQGKLQSLHVTYELAVGGSLEGLPKRHLAAQDRPKTQGVT